MARIAQVPRRGGERAEKSGLVAIVRERLEPTAAGEFVRLKALVDRLNALDGAPGVVVDLGGGKGSVRKLLRPDLRAGYVVVDRIPDGHGHRVVADLGALPIRKHSLRAACCSDVLEHIPDDRVFLASLLELLRPGGIAVLHVPSDRTPALKRIHDAVEESEEHDHQDFPHVRDGYSAAQLTGLLRELAPDARVDAVGSFSRGESLVADFDWYFWYKRWHPLRAVTWTLSRLLPVARRSGSRPPSRESSGLLVVVTMAHAPRMASR